MYCLLSIFRKSITQMANWQPYLATNSTKMSNSSKNQPAKRARPDSPEEKLKPPPNHMESYRLLRNLKTKLFRAEQHVALLSSGIKDGRPPARLQPRMRPYIPTNEAEFTISWETNCRDFALTQAKLLLGYWENRIPHLIKDIKCIEDKLKAIATREDYATIITLCDAIVEKHRNRPKGPTKKQQEQNRPVPTENAKK